MNRSIDLLLNELGEGSELFLNDSSDTSSSPQFQALDTAETEKQNEEDECDSDATSDNIDMDVDEALDDNEEVGDAPDDSEDDMNLVDSDATRDDSDMEVDEDDEVCGDSDERCSICRHPPRRRTELGCHCRSVFCEDCIEWWLTNYSPTCPTCRQDLYYDSSTDSLNLQEENLLTRLMSTNRQLRREHRELRRQLSTCFNFLIL